MENTKKRRQTGKSKDRISKRPTIGIGTNTLNMIIRMFVFLKSALPHLCLIMCLMLLVFFSIDQVNSHIGFMKNEFHKWLTLFLCLAVISESGMVISKNRRQIRKEEKRKNRNRQTTRMQNEPDQR
jgi:hypothetical protein